MIVSVDCGIQLVCKDSSGIDGVSLCYVCIQERKTIATDWGFQLDSTIETEVGIDDLPALETVPIGSGSFVWASVTSARRSSHSVSLNPDTCAGETILFRFNLTTTPA